MSATITWSIDKMQVKPTEGQYTDVVITAWWSCVGLQTVDAAPYPKNFTDATFGECSFSMPTGSFTPYDQLTQDQVLEWCWNSGVDKTATELGVQAQIDLKINPPVVTPPLPWAQGA